MHKNFEYKCLILVTGGVYPEMKVGITGVYMYVIV